MGKTIDLNAALAEYVEQCVHERLLKMFEDFSNQLRGAKQPAAAAQPAAKEATRAPVAHRKRRRASGEGMKQKVLEFIKKHPGLRSEQLQAELGNKEDVKAAIIQLRADQLVKMKGIKRAATYQA